MIEMRDGEGMTEFTLRRIRAEIVEDWAKERDALVKALEEIDAVAVAKKAGAIVRMQRIAREALAGLVGRQLHD